MNILALKSDIGIRGRFLSTPFEADRYLRLMWWIMRLMSLLIGLFSVACSGNGVFLSPQPTKPIKTRTQGATVSNDRNGSVRQNSNANGSFGPNAANGSATPAMNPASNQPYLDCFDNEIFSSAFVVDGHATLFTENGSPSSICSLLTANQKDTAVVQYLPAICNNCEQAIQNTWWAIERSGYQGQFLHVLALPTNNSALATQIQNYIDAAAIPAVIITDTGANLSGELLAYQQFAEPPRFFAVNSFLEVDFIPGDDERYLDIVSKAEAALLSVNAAAQELPPAPQTTWDGVSFLSTGLIDIHSITETSNAAGVANAF